MNITEKYCLKWNEFSLYICDSFKELRDDVNFCDVTLACDDGEQIKANKVVLSSCSPVLKNCSDPTPPSSTVGLERIHKSVPEAVDRLHVFRGSGCCSEGL
eukprot:TRINITY_DN23951_c0_g1_i1.p1 TRINITY_DN23951_c0_g1~~TRINITY_DN23951_c0_g1_i1.p1  ORF type:complete len:101 (+),score=15.00 TRINITY_DN23951_c0_g1_i1:109-411(+)